MSLLIIDNYDPQIATLVTTLGALGATVSVCRNDEIEIEEVQELAPERIVIAHGPDTPAEAGISLPLVREFATAVPILGLGLGHLTIGVAFGGRVIPLVQPFLEREVEITHTGGGVFAGVLSPLRCVPCDDMIVERATLPASLEVTAWTTAGLVMGLRHATLPIFGVQFLPAEPVYRQILTNFLQT